jgi:GT2 family glycosyltransferase
LMRENPRIAALMFQIIFVGDDIPEGYAERKPVIVRDFVGCGVLLRRELLLSLGGFEKRLLFYHEEPEYCFRSFQAGYDTYAYPSVVVRHVVTSANRRHAYRTRLFIRNVILLDLWYYPHPQSFLRAFGHVPLLWMRMPMLRKHWWSYIMGSVEGFYCYMKWWPLRKRLTREQLAEWEKRSSAVHVTMGSRTPMWK